METIERFLIKKWGSIYMAYDRELINALSIQRLVKYEGQAIIGLLTFFSDEKGIHIISLNSERSNCGIGSELLIDLENYAKTNKIKIIWIETTNDNYRAIKFYQKKGFDMFEFKRNEVDYQRRLKPNIPELSSEGIPIKHIIVFIKNIL